MEVNDVINVKKTRTILGITFILFGIVCLINIGYVAQTLAIMFTFVFGLVAYWFFFPGLIITGIFLIVNRDKEIKIKKSVFLIGLSLFFFSLLVLMTTAPFYDGRLHFGTFNQLFWDSWMEAIKTPFKGNGYIRVSPLTSVLGGGWLGFLFSTILNTLITPLGTVISLSFVFAISLVLMFHKQMKWGYQKAKEKYEAHKVAKLERIAKEVEEKSLEQPEENIEVEEYNEMPANPINPNPGPLLEEEESDDSFMGEKADELAKANLYSNDDAPILTNENNEEIGGPLKQASLLSNDSKMIDNIPNIDKKEKIKITRPYQLPSFDLLETYEVGDIIAKNEESCANNETIINATFSALRIGAKVVGHTIGPRVTRYDIQVDANSSIQAIPKYVSDISQRLGGVQARFEPIVAGKVTSGLEVPNKESATIGFKEIVSTLPQGEKNHLLIPFGKNITGEIKYADLAKFPHLLIGGATGSGKSVFVHSIIMSLIMRNTPSEVRLLLVDPKRVEFTHYKNSPFLLCPVVTDPKKAKVALEKVVEEMERRYTLFESNMTNNIISYNTKIRQNNGEPLPYIVTIVDEFADLIQQNKKIDLDIARIVAKARAAGIHLVIATQRPSVDVITGTIKSNLPVRVALSVPDVESSKTILGGMGAEQLLGNGDMLVSCPQIQANGCVRVQGCYVSDSEIDKVVNFINSQREPLYDPRFMDLEDHNVEEVKGDDIPKVSAAEARALKDEDLYNYVKEQVYKREYTSISLIERENAIGFTRAGRIFKRLQDEGLVARESEASKGSKVLKENFHFDKKEPTIGSEELSSTEPNKEG